MGRWSSTVLSCPIACRPASPRVREITFLSAVRTMTARHSLPTNTSLMTHRVTPRLQHHCGASTNCVPINNVGGVDETWYNPERQQILSRGARHAPQRGHGRHRCWDEPVAGTTCRPAPMRTASRSTPAPTMSLCPFRRAQSVRHAEFRRLRRGRRRTMKMRSRGDIVDLKARN